MCVCDSIRFLDYGKQAYIFRCQEIETGMQFRMKLIETARPSHAILYYGQLNPILESREASFQVKKHTEVELSPKLINYLEKLRSGEVCGLFHDGKEDKSLSIRLFRR